MRLLQNLQATVYFKKLSGFNKSVKGNKDGSNTTEFHGLKISGESCVWCGGVPVPQYVHHRLGMRAVPSLT